LIWLAACDGPEAGPASDDGNAGDTSIEADCPLFSASFAMNDDVSGNEQAAQEDDWINAIGRDTSLSLAAGPVDGIPWVEVTGEADLVDVTFSEYPELSTPGPYRLPLDTPVQPTEDARVIAWDVDHCNLFEGWHATAGATAWTMGLGVIWDTESFEQRDARSADSSGLPVLPGLLTVADLESGSLEHALGVTAPLVQSAWVRPAAASPSLDASANLPPMGARFRASREVDCPAMDADSAIVCEGLRRFGMIVTETGTAWALRGDADARWADHPLPGIAALTGNDLQAVDAGEVRTE
jgi:hypothetical protein